MALTDDYPTQLRFKLKFMNLNVRKEDLFNIKNSSLGG